MFDGPEGFIELKQFLSGHDYSQFRCWPGSAQTIVGMSRASGVMELLTNAPIQGATGW